MSNFWQVEKNIQPFWLLKLFFFLLELHHFAMIGYCHFDIENKEQIRIRSNANNALVRNAIYGHQRNVSSKPIMSISGVRRWVHARVASPEFLG